MLQLGIDYEEFPPNLGKSGVVEELISMSTATAVKQTSSPKPSRCAPICSGQKQPKP
ncbi:MAG: hypothetical protein IPL28_25235 [Chloroflexi bacterium]|nr:hypothetical protein [Chloroflexota bacterium]